jgi:Calx-beta domain
VAVTDNGGASTASAAASTVAFTAPTFRVNPSTAFAVISVSRAGESTDPATANFTTLNGSAVAGVDYAATTGALDWASGDVSAKHFSVPISTMEASDKSFSVALTSASGAEFGAQLSATVVIDGSSGNVGTGSVTLSWSAPTANTNGSTLTDLAGYYIYFGTSPMAMVQQISLGAEQVSMNNAGLLSYSIGDLALGTWYFEIIAVTASRAQSPPSPVVTATI